MAIPLTGTAERRAHDRHPFRTAAVLTLQGGRAVEARTLDIGNGGAGVVVDFNVPVNTTVSVRMSLPARPSGSAVFETQATVVNCTLAGSDGGFRVGLKFGVLSASASAALKGVLP